MVPLLVNERQLGVVDKMSGPASARDLPTLLSTAIMRGWEAPKTSSGALLPLLVAGRSLLVIECQDLSLTTLDLAFEHPGRELAAMYGLFDETMVPENIRY